LVSGPPEDKKFPGLRYVAKEKDKAVAVAFKIYNDLFPEKVPKEDMELVWKAYSKDPSKSNGPYACIKQSEGFFPKITQHIIHWFPDFLEDLLMEALFPELLDEPFRQRCPPIPTIDAGHFLYADTDMESKNLIEELIKGKIVFYGADLDAINDLVYPPTH
jgi:hypothetical protein